MSIVLQPDMPCLVRIPGRPFPKENWRIGESRGEERGEGLGGEKGNCGLDVIYERQINQSINQ